MKQAELAMSLADMQEKIDNTVHEATTQFNNMFKATSSDNEQSDLEFSAHNAMERQNRLSAYIRAMCLSSIRDRTKTVNRQRWLICAMPLPVLVWKKLLSMLL